MADGLALEASIVSLVFEHVVDDTSKFFGNDRTSDGLVGATEDLLVEASVFREVLNGTDSHVGEGNLKVLVAVFPARLVPKCFVGVLGTGDETAIGDEVFVRAEPFDAIGFQIDGEGGHFAHAGDPHEALDVFVRDEDGLQKVLYVEDLCVQQLDLLVEVAQMELIGFRQVLGDRAFLDHELVAAIEFSAKIVDADAAGGTLLDQAQTSSHDITEVPELGPDLMCFRDRIQAEQFGKGL
jgi:hypothetical protein